MSESNQQILELYCIRDLKVQRFLPPFFASNKDEAIRLMREQVNYKTSLINSFPDDYELYYLGTFSDFTGEIITDNAICICNLSDLVTDDSVKYDELLNTANKLVQQSAVFNQRFESLIQDCTLRFDSFLDNLKTRVSNYENVQNDSKKSFLSNLFSD